MADPAPAASTTLIAIPFYKNEQLVDPIIDSLIACAGDLDALGAEVLLFNDSPDYAPLGAALAAALTRAQMAFTCRLVTNPENLGFVRTMNRAMAEAAQRRCDIALLNSDTIVFPGALTEMTRVARLDPMIGFVNPRSNNATLATLPHQQHLHATREAGIAAAKTLAAQLPDYTYVPTAVGFCLLIRWQILAEFGVFDEIYGKGYNEENDLIMRAGRCGYRAVLANKAYVWHEGEVSFGASDSPRVARERANREILLKRYPEYAGLTARYFRSPEYIAEALLGAMLGAANGKLDLAFDFSSFGAYHNGTFRAGAQLLSEAARCWGDRFNLYVLCIQSAYEFHGYARYGVKRADPHGPEQFAAIFRVGQPYDWNCVERAVTKGASLGVYMLDTISIDCTQLRSEQLVNLWQFVLDRFDLLATTSELTADQLDRRFVINPNIVRVRAMHSLDVSDYVMVAPQATSDRTPGYVLLVGNHFPHKFMPQTANALAEAMPEQSFVAFGIKSGAKLKGAGRGLYAPDDNIPHANVACVATGDLSDGEVGDLFAKASVVVFPSHYEGFGFPVFETLAAKRPLLVRRTPVTTEIAAKLGDNPNIHLYDTTADLIAKLRDPPRWIEATGRTPIYGAVEAADDIRAGIERALGGVTYAHLVSRLHAVQHVNDMISLLTGSSTAARAIGQYAERFASRLLRIEPIRLSARAAWHGAKAVRQGFRDVKAALFSKPPA